jgi:hypothetical protein
LLIFEQELKKDWPRVVSLTINNFDGEIGQNTTFCRSKHKFSRTDFTFKKTVSPKLLIMGFNERLLPCHILDCQV